MNDEGTSKLLDIYFQVNMEIEIAADRFDPATDLFMLLETLMVGARQIHAIQVHSIPMFMRLRRNFWQH